MHVSERFVWLLAICRKPDGSVWGGQDLETATRGIVSRSYVANLKKGRIQSPRLDKLEAIARAMGFPPRLWFGIGIGDGSPGPTLEADLKNETVREILWEVLRLGPRDRRLLLGITRQISSPELEHGNGY